VKKTSCGLQEPTGGFFMALVESVDIPLGTKMPPFVLPDPNGSLHDGTKLYGAKGLLVVITCNHCPYALAVWPRLIRLSIEIAKAGVNTVGINPNIHPDYPEDSPKMMKDKIYLARRKFHLITLRWNTK